MMGKELQNPNGCAYPPLLPLILLLQEWKMKKRGDEKQSLRPPTTTNAKFETAFRPSSCSYYFQHRCSNSGGVNTPSQPLPSALNGAVTPGPAVAPPSSDFTLRLGARSISTRPRSTQTPTLVP